MSNHPRKVLFSPGYGAGWSTWHSGEKREEQEFMLFYEPLIEALENDEDIGYKENPYVGDEKWNAEQHARIHAVPGSALDLFITDWIEKFGTENIPYLGGARDLKVHIAMGPFRIDEYDGFESVMSPGAENWF